MLMKRLIAVTFFMIVAQSCWARQDPLELVRETADRVLNEVTVHKSTLNKDTSGIYVLVSTHVLPHFDFTNMTQSAMGKYWRRADSEQKKLLVDGFRELLVRTYGVALLHYSGEKISYLPVRESDDKNRVTVQTKISEVKGGPEIPVDYRLKYNDETWQVYDVVIDGVSLVSNYRTSFSSEIRRVGIDGLIKKLAEQNKG